MLQIVASMRRSLLSTAFVRVARQYDPSNSQAWRIANDLPERDHQEHLDLDRSLQEEGDLVAGDFWSHVDTSGALTETCFWIDVNIDGIQLFKNSKAPQVCFSGTMPTTERLFSSLLLATFISPFQAVPILMRVYGIGDGQSPLPDLITPLNLCPPIIVGVYHGQEAPNRNFVKHFLDEVHQLHPFSPRRHPVTNALLRACSVRIRCMICDAKERAFLRGEYIWTCPLFGNHAYSILILVLSSFQALHL